MANLKLASCSLYGKYIFSYTQELNVDIVPYFMSHYEEFDLIIIDHNNIIACTYNI